MLSRFVHVGTTLVVLGLMSANAYAQGGGRGGPGGGRGMGGARGTASDLMGLLVAPEVRKEVGLGDEGWAAVEKIQKESRDAMMAMFRNGGAGFGRDASEADRAKAQAEREKMSKESSEKAQAVLDEVLPPEGLDRLLGLYVQLRGDSSIVGELPAKKLNLSDADKEKIQEAITKAREAGGGFGGRGGAGGTPGERPSDADREAMMKQMRERMAEMQKKSDEAVQGVLTDAQKKAVADLKGAKFEFPESVRNGGFGGFGGFGGPGAPGGQPRGGRPRAESGT